VQGKDGPIADRFVVKVKRTRPPTPPPWSEPYYKAYMNAVADPAGLDPHFQGSEGNRPPSPDPVSSRVGPMLHELVALLKNVIVPPTISAPCGSKHAPSRLIIPSQSAADARHLLSHFDPPLIKQELERGIFDPQGLFGMVGETLKRHCAPMRDRQVDAMVNAVKGSEGTSTQRAIKAMRLCFEILELMKLVSIP
jgi:T-complex protein 11